MQAKHLCELIIKTLEDNKAQAINEMDVTKLTDVMDFMIICSATSNRHAKTLADKLLRTAKDKGIRPLGVEGEDKGDWILVDLNDVVVHIMLPETREFYSLEKLWTVTEESRQKVADSSS